MSLSQKSRTAIYTGLTEFVDEQAVEEMLSFFPSRDLDEPVTKEFLRAEMADLRAEMHGGLAEGRVGLAELRSEMHQGFRRLTMAIYGSMVATAGVVIAAATITG